MAARDRKLVGTMESPELALAAAVVASYLIGSIDFAIFISRLHGVDIRTQGSGNPGTANVVRVVGVVPGVMVLVGDVLKGLLAAVLGAWAAGVAHPEQVLNPVNAGEVMLAGAAAVIGHCYPAFHRFQGGKGVATMFGAMLFIVPWSTVILAVLWVVVARVARFPAAGSTATALAYLPISYWQGMRFPALGWLLLVVVLIFFRHRSNLTTWRERKSDTQ